MPEPSPPSGISLSAVGQDNTVKRPSSGKNGLKPPYRGPPGGLLRVPSAGFLQGQKTSRRRKILWAVFAAFLALVAILLFRDLKVFSNHREEQGFADSFAPAMLGVAPVQKSSNMEIDSSEPEARDPESPSELHIKKGKSHEHRKGDRNQDRNRGKDKQKQKERHRSQRSKGERDRRSRETRDSQTKETKQRPLRASPPLPFNPLEPMLAPTHRCANFTLPPPPTDPKRSGPRPCPVCYLDTEEALALKPERHRASAEPVLKEVTFVTEADEGEQKARASGKRPRFAGYQTLEERSDSFNVREKMHVHCGFVWGGEPGTNTGFDSSDEDREYMRSCTGVVVASAIFGAYDLVQQPSGMSDIARETVCFVMFVDEITHNSLLQDGTLKDDGKRQVGLWRLVVVSNLPYKDPRRTGKIPKLLSHRLFPNAQFSIWVDAKLELRVDPYKLLERFLWRGNFTWAISRHYARFDIYVEAERNKAAGKYKNVSIDEQMEVYRQEGMTPYSDKKLPIISDVPEGCVIIRELTPLTNLLACIWFNEVDRFTSRDQLSFGFCRDKIRVGVPGWNVNMFLDCERRNFVVQNYHKDVLKEKFSNSKAAVSTSRPKS